MNSIPSSVIDPWQVLEVTEWKSNKLGPESYTKPVHDSGMPPAFANDLGSGAHLGWSDGNKCNDVQNPQNKFTLCYVHVLTGLVDLSLSCDERIQTNPNIEGYPYECPADAETFYHTIQPGQLTTFNLSIANHTPGPSELVQDTFALRLDGVPNNWTATLFFSTNNTPIFDSTPVFLEGGDVVPLYV